MGHQSLFRSFPGFAHDLTMFRSQLYFDRIHGFVPILHQRRYYSWAHDAATTTEGRRSLQYAMWSLAASVSAQFQHISDSLYHHTRRMLHNVETEATDVEIVDIEQVQAYILVAIYEFMRTDYRRGWMSAGRAFRLIQLMRLHEIDVPSRMPAPVEWIEVEERRRTFWMAYSLDRFISIQNGWPLTLSEQVVGFTLLWMLILTLTWIKQIMIRLPAPDANFQGSQPFMMGFLSEAITANDQSVMSPFTECIILATISGRALSHRHQSLVENIYVDASQDFWDRHRWIDAILTQRIQILSLKYSPASQHADPLLLFTSMIAQATVLYLHKTLQCVTLSAANQAEMMQYETCSLVAAQAIVGLSDFLTQQNCLKARCSDLQSQPFGSQPPTGPSIYPDSVVPLCGVLICASRLRQFLRAATSAHSRGPAQYKTIQQACTDFPLSV